MRFYDFQVGEIITPDSPNLNLQLDPKHAWALRNRGQFPVDVNKADRELLLRVPGIGVRNANRILKLRRHRAIRLSDLRRLSVPLKRAQPFIIAADHNPAVFLLDDNDLERHTRPAERQLMLFDTSRSAATGEL